MRTIIAGSRSISDHGALLRCLAHVTRQGVHITRVLSGHANGVDKMGELWWRSFGREPDVMEPDYGEHPGHLAPLVRNTAMADSGAEVLVLLHKGTAGSRDMLEKARARGLWTFAFTYDGGPGLPALDPRIALCGRRAVCYGAHVYADGHHMPLLDPAGRRYAGHLARRRRVGTPEEQAVWCVAVGPWPAGAGPQHVWEATEGEHVDHLLARVQRDCLQAEIQMNPLTT